MDTDEGLYHAAPQTIGKISHSSIDNRTYSSHKDDYTSIAVFSEKYNLSGKIDLFKKQEGILIERKYKLKHIYSGHYYQLWAQYFCLTEMGYKVNKLAFYEISSIKMIYIPLPDKQQTEEFEIFLKQYRSYSPSDPITVNSNKCIHCIYCNLCDLAECENVYN